MLTNTTVRTLPLNTQGTDYVVGDIHGCFDLVDQALARLGFAPDQDRLLCVGDLIDRGPQSAQVDAFLARPYVYAVRGNHEDELLAMYEYDPALVDEIDIDAFPSATQNALLNPMGTMWWLAVDRDKRRTILESFLKLPLAIEVSTPRGLVGLIHADIPNGMSWPAFTQALRSGDASVSETALWGRTRAHRDDHQGVAGVGRVFCGHTPHERITRRENVYFVDTGAVFQDGFLSVTKAIADTASIEDSGIALSHAITKLDQLIENRPFGNYAKEPQKGGPQ